MRHPYTPGPALEGQLYAKAWLERPLVVTITLAGLAPNRPSAGPRVISLGFWAEASTSWPELARPGPGDPTCTFWRTKAAN